MASALELSRERYETSRLKAPGWVPVPLVTPMTVKAHQMVEHAVAAIHAYHHASVPVCITLTDDSVCSGWVESVYTVRDPDPHGEGTRSAALIAPETGDAFAIDLTGVLAIDTVEELQDRI